MSQGQDQNNPGFAGHEKGAPAAVPSGPTTEPHVVVHNERQALVMAVVVFLIALTSWGSAQFACNKRPTQYKTPTTLTTEQLTSTAKDAAIELQQRDLGGDVAGATEIADGPLLQELQARKAQCQAAGNCGAKTQVVTRAEVLRVEGPSVLVKTTTLVGGAETRALLRMERRNQQWKALERTAQ